MSNFEAADHEYYHVALLLWLGSRLTVFYRKGFKVNECSKSFSDLGNFGLAILCFLMQTWEVNPSFMSSIVQILWPVFDTIRCLDTAEEILKSALLAGSIHFAMSGSVVTLSWTATCVMATTQLLRWPSSLKMRLRSIRTVCGPSYAILITGACIRETFASTDGEAFQITYQLRSPSLLECAAASSILASVLFRPDNQELWAMCFWPVPIKNWEGTPSLKQQKHIHALLMIVSYICMVVKFSLLDLGCRWRVVGALLIAGSCLGCVLGVGAIRNVFARQFQGMKNDTLPGN